MRATVHLRHKCQPKTKSNFARPFIRWHFLCCGQLLPHHGRPHCKSANLSSGKYKTPMRHTVKWVALRLPFLFVSIVHCNKVILCGPSVVAATCNMPKHIIYFYFYIYESQLNHHINVLRACETNKKNHTMLASPLAPIANAFVIPQPAYVFFFCQIYSIFVCCCALVLVCTADAFNMLFYGYCFEISIKRSLTWHILAHAMPHRQR